MPTIVPSHPSRKRRGLDGALRFHGIMKHEEFEWATCLVRHLARKVPFRQRTLYTTCEDLLGISA